MKTHFKKLRNPNYIGSWDLADANGKYIDKVVTITSVTKEIVHDGKGGSEECTVIKLKETKPMVANSTNLRTIAKVCGSPYIEDWTGNQIALTVRQVKAFGEVHDAIRVKAEKPVPASKENLSPEHPRWAGAVTALREGKTTIDAIRKAFALTSENEAKLKEAANA